jgi:Flp pilus assembly protein TadG
MWPGSGPPRRVMPSAARRRGPLARPDDDSGVVAIVVALLTTVFIGLAALVVDHGLAADTELRAKNAADASALAAAVVLSRSGTAGAADTSAKAYALANFGVSAADWASCTTSLPAGYAPLAGTPCISRNAALKLVRVVLPNRTFATIFAGIAGFSHQTVGGDAEASYGPSTASTCLLCVLTAIDGGTGGIRGTGGDIRAAVIRNFNGPGGIDVTGGGTFYSTSFDGSGRNSPAPQPGGTAGDPYASVPYPPIPAGAPAAGRGLCPPGNYTSIRGCTAFTAGGVYFVTGSTGNQAQVDATDVMFFLTCGSATEVHYCAAGESGGVFEGAGGTDYSITGLTSGPYQGFAVFADRNNAATQRWRGNGIVTVIGGIMYSASAAGVDTSAGNGKIVVQRGQLVVGTLKMNGVGRDKYHIEVTGPVPPTPPAVVPPAVYLTR